MVSKDGFGLGVKLTQKDGWGIGKCGEGIGLGKEGYGLGKSVSVGWDGLTEGWVDFMPNV